MSLPLPEPPGSTRRSSAEPSPLDNRSERLTVLVLGVGGNVSQGILKALARSSVPVRVIAGCISASSMGLYLADRAYISPEAEDEKFLPWLTGVCERERVRAILSGVEEVLQVLSAHAGDIKDRTGAVAVASDPDVLAIGRDKLRTCRWLEEMGLPHPHYADGDDEVGIAELVEVCGYPLVAKPRLGKGAAGVRIVESQSGLEAARDVSGLIFQEHLDEAGGELTVGCVCDRARRVRGTIAMRRTLVAGTTYSADVVDRETARSVAERIVARLGPLGPCNVQLRFRRGQPVPFELNVRFSGTTPLRTHLGFTEVDAVLRHFVLGEPMQDLPVVRRGSVLRYWNELYVDPAASEALARDGYLADPGAYAPQMEDWGMR